MYAKTTRVGCVSINCNISLNRPNLQLAVFLMVPLSLQLNLLIHLPQE